MGFERLRAQGVPRHQHAEAYATILLSGAYEQFSYAGRLRAEPGDILVQPTLDCHFNRILSEEVVLIRLPWRFDNSVGGVYRDCHTDMIARAAERDLREASAMLQRELANLRVIPVCMHDWTDMLAADLAIDPTLRIGEWADRKGITREHVWRGFRTAYAVGPTQFRSELNARAAWSRISCSSESMSRIAANLGFADQAHMSRAVKALTGLTPVQLRSRRFGPLLF